MTPRSQESLHGAFSVVPFAVVVVAPDLGAAVLAASASVHAPRWSAVDPSAPDRAPRYSPPPVARPAARAERRAFFRFSLRLGLLTLVFAAEAAFAQAMVGQSLLTFAGNYLIAPLGIFAMVIALAGAFFRPDLAKSGVTAAIICAVIFFVIRMAPQLTTALKN